VKSQKGDGQAKAATGEKHQDTNEFVWLGDEG